MKITVAISLILVAAVSACGGSNYVKKHPDTLKVEVENGALMGFYKAEAWTEAEVRALAPSGCAGDAIEALTLIPADANGVSGFSATCAQGTVVPAGTGFIDRAGDGKVRVEYIARP